MRIQHKQLRDSRIAIGPHAFNVNSEGFLVPDPTPDQWRAFGGAQKYFTIVAVPVTPATPAPPAEVFVLPDPEDAMDELVAAIKQDAVEAAQAEAAAGGTAAPEEAAASEEEVFGFSDDLEDLDAPVEGDSIYAAMNFDQLKAECRALGIPVARASRAALIQRLIEAQG